MNSKTGKIDDKNCQYKWMYDKLLNIELNYKTPEKRIKKIYEHHMGYLATNIRILLNHCSAPSFKLIEIADV